MNKDRLQKVVLRFSQDMRFTMRYILSVARHYRVVTMPIFPLYQPVVSVDVLRTSFIREYIRIGAPKYIYLLVPVAVWYPEEDHANFLIIDVQKGVCLRFEPHGGMPENRAHWDKSSFTAVTSVESRQIKLYLDGMRAIIGRQIGLVNASLACPYFGTQFSQSRWFERNSVDIRQGLCVILSVLTMTRLLSSLRQDETKNQTKDLLQVFKNVQLELGASNSPYDMTSLDRTKTQILAFVDQVYAQWF